jgi:hypothetical protein
VGVVPSGTTTSLGYTVNVSQPVDYGAETITVTGSILTATATVTAHICAPDFRTSVISVTSVMVVAHEELTYTFRIRNTGDADAIGARALITLSVNPLFLFQEVITVTSGVTTLIGPITQPTYLEWQGDVPIGGEVLIVWHTHSRFGLPAIDIVRPFEITHPWRPPFYGVAQYPYPHKLYFVVILKDMASPRR